MKLRAGAQQAQLASPTAGVPSRHGLKVSRGGQHLPTATAHYDWSVAVLSCLFSIFTGPDLGPTLCCTDPFIKTSCYSSFVDECFHSASFLEHAQCQTRTEDREWCGWIPVLVTEGQVRARGVAGQALGGWAGEPPRGGPGLAVIKGKPGSWREGGVPKTGTALQLRLRRPL